MNGKCSQCENEVANIYKEFGINNPDPHPDPENDWHLCDNCSTTFFRKAWESLYKKNKIHILK